MLNWSARNTTMWRSYLVPPPSSTKLSVAFPPQQVGYGVMTFTVAARWGAFEWKR